MHFVSLKHGNSNKNELKEEFKLIKTPGESIPNTICRISLATQAALETWDDLEKCSDWKNWQIGMKTSDEEEMVRTLPWKLII